MPQPQQYKSEIVFHPKPETLELRLNELAAQGWELLSVIQQPGGDMLLILRKDRP